MEMYINKKDEEDFIVLASSEKEYKILKKLFPHTWGFHHLWRKKETISPPYEKAIKLILGNFPDTVAIGFLKTPEKCTVIKNEKGEEL